MADEQKKNEQEQKPEVDKKVDSEWKEQVQSEKRAAGEQAPTKQEAPLPPPEFATFINSLAVQALIALGEIENPIAKKTEADLDQAKYTIDILGMIEEKTKGNLSAQEKQALDQILYDLRMRYVAAVGA